MFFPNGSGIYKFIGVYNEPLYVGKAKNHKKNFFIFDENRQTRRIKTLISLTIL